MNIEALNCRCCGGVLKVSSALCVCEYCGATNFVSDTAGKYINQLNRANKLRQEKEYDNALRIYDNILSENIATADILWLRTLCEYGIEYVPDPISSKYFPTLHRIKDESILNYHSYLEALKLCDEKQRAILEKEATEINRIQTEYLDIAKNEDPYDVFICYKETDEDTKTTTEDVAYCCKLYDILTQKGYKVFFARVTLQDKLSVDFEPYIFAALKSSKAMAVVGSKSEYFTATWVKNEWSRFLKLMESDTKKQIFFACDDPEELPRAFSLKQAQLLSDPNAMENLAKNIDNYLNFIVTGKQNTGTSAKKINRNQVQIMLENAFAKSKQGNFPAVLSLAADLIDANPDMAEAYWLRMTANLRHSTENIKYIKRDLTQDEDYQKALSLANDELKAQYISIRDECLNNMKLQNDFYEKLDEYADDFEKNITSNIFYRKRRDIIKEIDVLSKELENTPKINILSIKSTEKRIIDNVKELDDLNNRILNDFTSKGIAKYREFISQNNIPDKVEIDMESEHYISLRKKILDENRAIREKYIPKQSGLADSEDMLKTMKEDNANSPLKAYYRSVANASARDE